MDNRPDSGLDWCLFTQLVGFAGIDSNCDGFYRPLSSVSAVWDKYLQDEE